MAVVSTVTDSRLQLKLQTGQDADGNPIIKTKTYSRVKPAALDEDVYAIAKAIAALQTNPLVAVKRVDEEELTETV